MNTVLLLNEAEQDLAEAAAFLDRRVTNLGEQLTAEVSHSLQRLATNPNVGPLIASDIRRLGVRRFPYDLIYRVHADAVIVLAVAHQRRKPGWWTKRR